MLGLPKQTEIKRQLSKSAFAIAVDEHPQTLGAIIKGRRKMKTALALKIEQKLGIQEGYLMTLQVFYDIKEEKRRQQENLRPDLSKIRRVLFWDTKLEALDWQQQKKAIIRRVYERGNDIEQAEIMRFYGKQTIDTILNHASV